MHIFQVILVSLIGLPVSYMGWYIWKKEQIGLIHSYHYKNVSESDRKPYTKEVGQALMLIGFGVVIAEIIMQFSKLCGLGCYGSCFIIAFIKLHKAQMKYNGSWF